MQDVLKDIQSGAFADRWIAENKDGAPSFRARRRAETEHPLEQVGARLRAMMPFVSPVTIRPGE